MTTLDRENSKSPLTATTPLIEERLEKGEHTDGLYLPKTSTLLLKRKQDMLYLPLEFKNNQSINSLVDSRAYVNANAQNELDTIGHS